MIGWRGWWIDRKALPVNGEVLLAKSLMETGGSDGSIVLLLVTMLVIMSDFF